MDEIDLEVMLDSFLQEYTKSGHLINVNTLKRIVRLCMIKLFHIGFSYGLKYRKCGKPFNYEPYLFSKQEMEIKERNELKL